MWLHKRKDMNKSTHSAERDHVERVPSPVDLIKEIAVGAMRGVVDLQLIACVPKNRACFNKTEHRYEWWVKKSPGEVRERFLSLKKL